MNRLEKAQITKEKIINAARILAKEKLIQDISVEDITKKAEVSKGSFYTYFKKKEDVLEKFMFDNWNTLRIKISDSRESKIKLFEYYIINFATLIEEKGKETCRSWISTNINNDYKLLYDEETLTLLFNDKKTIEIVNSFLYGLMLSWAMANDERSLVQMAKNAIPYFLISFIKENG